MMQLACVAASTDREVAAPRWMGGKYAARIIGLIRGMHRGFCTLVLFIGVAGIPVTENNWLIGSVPGLLPRAD